MVGCVFLSQNWAPLVKTRFFKWLAAFFRIGHHSKKFTNGWLRFLSQNWAPLVKKRFFTIGQQKNHCSPELGNYQTKIFNSVWHQIYNNDFLQWICYKLGTTFVEKIYKWLAAFFCPKIGHHSLKKFTNGWLRFFVPKIGHHKLLAGWKNLQMVGCVFLSQNWAPLVKKNLQMVGCVFLSQNWAPLVEKIYKWLAAFFCPKIGHHSLKKFTNGWLRFFVPKLGTTR